MDVSPLTVVTLTKYYVITLQIPNQDARQRQQKRGNIIRSPDPSPLIPSSPGSPPFPVTYNDYTSSKNTLYLLLYKSDQFILVNTPFSRAKNPFFFVSGYKTEIQIDEIVPENKCHICENFLQRLQ